MLQQLFHNGKKKGFITKLGGLVKNCKALQFTKERTASTEVSKLAVWYRKWGAKKEISPL